MTPFEVGLSSRDLAAGLVGGHGLERIAVLHVRGEIRPVDGVIRFLWLVAKSESPVDGW